MLQPRKIILLLTLHIVLGIAEDVFRDPDDGRGGPSLLDRTKRETPEVSTILLIDNDGGFGKSGKPAGLLTSTARTFVNEGTTTEYATQVVGTTLDNGRLYAQILQTTSRVYFGDQKYKPVKNTLEPFIKPTEPVFIFPTKALNLNLVQPAKDEISEAHLKQTEEELFAGKDVQLSPASATDDERELLENVIRARKLDNKRNAEGIKPTKVYGGSLPTFTVKHDFAPSGFTPNENVKEEKKEDKNKLRLGKNLFAKPTQAKFDTVTYAGFADFTTTVANTVIIFTPHTKGAPEPVEPSQPAVEPPKVMTDVKTFMSHSPAMVTKTVPGHSITMQTAIPTVAAERKSKGFDNNEAREAFLAKEQDFFAHPGSESASAVTIEPSEASDYASASKSSQPTEPLATYATTVTRSFNQAGVAKPLGLLKSIGGTKAYNGTTTKFTSLIYGTYVGKSYTQILQTSSNSFYVTENAGKKATVYLDGPTTTPEPSTEELDEEVLTTGDETPVTEETTAPPAEEPEVPIEPTDQVVSRVVPSTVYKTYTYLTTFFIPSGETSTTTSIRSREVVSSEVQYVTKVIDDDWLSTAMLDIEPTQVNLIENTESLDSEFQLPPVRILAPETVVTTTEEASVEPETTVAETTEPVVQTSVVPEAVEEEPTSTTTSQTSTSTTTEAPETTTQKRVSTTKEAPSTTESPETTTQKRFSFTKKAPSTTQRKFSTTTTTTETPVTTEKQIILTTPSDISDETEEEEIEVVYKTLYTTYTYLTTFFQESTTSVSSREEVVTNIITSTLGETIQPTRSADVIEPTTTESTESVSASEVASQETLFTTYTYYTTLFDEGTTSIISRTDVVSNIVPTPSASALPASILADEQLFKAKFEMLLREQQALKSASPVTEQPITVAPSSTTPEPEAVSEEKPTLDIRPTGVLKRNKYGTITRKLKRPLKLVPSEASSAEIAEPTVRPTPKLEKSGRTVVRRRLKTKARLLPKSTTVIDEQEGVTIIHLDPALPNSDQLSSESLVTDVTKSTSKGRQVKRIAQRIGRAQKSDPILDDQIISETNNEEVMPSPTILLQTSFTTFTYFTTVYKGSTSSDIISRLETVTNVVTETVAPDALLPSSVSPEDATLPITYFTTFTYWTTLYRDGNTVVTSREETISNVVTPTIEATPTTSKIEPTVSASIEPTIVQPVVPSVFVPGFIPAEPTSSETASPISTKPIEDVTEPIIPKQDVDDQMQPTTFYTTYTYFTTSYIGESTVVKSRLETITNVVNTSSPISEVDDNSLQTGRAINPANANNIEATPAASLKTGLLSTLVSSSVNDDKTTLYSTDVFGTYIDGIYAKILESTTKIVTADEISAKPVAPADAQKTGVVSINEGKIVDADGISTTFFTTKAIGTSIENLYAQVVESTSSVLIDVDKKSALANIQPAANDIFKTGLVRLIEGSIIKDDTTTLYESRVIGTVIDGRYAQIIESTSSYKIAPTATVKTKVEPTVDAGMSTAAPSAIQGSEPEDDDDDDDEYDENDKGKGKGKSRLSFQQKKKTFTPVIRPFASRSRPTFLPKKKAVAVPSAQTVTPSKFTPTVTATLATKSDGRNRFNGRRSSSSSVEVKPTATSTRKFQGRSRSVASIPPSSAPSSAISRGRSSGRVSATPALNLSSSRSRGFQRSSAVSSAEGPRSSIAPARLRIRPTLSGFPGRGLTSSTTPEPPKSSTPALEDEEEEEEDEEFEEEPIVTSTTTTTEDPNLSRRNGNPLLRLRRPTVPRGTTSRPETTTSAPRRGILNVNRNRPKTTTTTTPASTTTRRTRPASSFGNRAQLPNRPRPVNNLFPPRTFPQKSQKEEINDTDEGEEDFEYEEDSSVQETAFQKTESDNKLQARRVPQLSRRSKRQADYGYRSSSRYSRPTSRNTNARTYDYYDYDYVVTEAPKVTPRQRGRSRAIVVAPQTPATPTTISPRIRPSVTSNSRTQFTLRKEDSTTSNPRSNFRRTQATTPRRRISNYKTTEAPTTVRRPTRLRPQTTVPSAQRRGFTNSRSRTSTTRSRGRYNDDDIALTQPDFDGTITVTHKIPSEVTIPIVNGKVTEYRNVITAKPSLQVLGPHQYTVTSTNGGTLLFLNNEVTSTLNNGAVEVTKFLVHQTPTSSVTFTPTTIRGRKTSYSHLVPSTVYEVENLVSTIQPSLPSPLANILLSQLLLGNLNLPQNAQQPTGPQTPTTEYKTKTTTYVTSVTESKSTVIPLTFRGKEILTTILDSSVNVITATEFLTETIVVTPSVAAPNNQLNSLLLPALLQAQLLQTSAPTLPLIPSVSLDNLQLDERPKTNGLRESDEVLEEEKEEVKKPSPKQRKKAAVEPAKEVVTLYVSGRRPGEFSTVVSTVDAGDSTVRKREALVDDIDRLLAEASEVKQVRVLASQLPSFEQTSSLYDVEIGSSEVFVAVPSEQQTTATQSLESVVGDISMRPTETSSPSATVTLPVSTKATKKLTNLSKSPKKDS